jgi:hypothetical protein
VMTSSPRTQDPHSRGVRPTKPSTPTTGAEAQGERAGGGSRAVEPDAPVSAITPKEANRTSEQAETPEGQQKILSGLTRDERESAESSCASAKRTHGTDAYNECLTSQIRELEGVPHVDLSGFSKGDVQLIQSMCSTDKFLKGPAAYRACLARHSLAMP